MYRLRIGKIMGTGFHRGRRIMFKCTWRCNAMYDYPGCPNNKGFGMIELKGGLKKEYDSRKKE